MMKQVEPSSSYCDMSRRLNRQTATSSSYNRLGRSMYTSQGASMRSYAPKTLITRDNDWVNIRSMLKSGGKRTRT